MAQSVNIAVEDHLSDAVLRTLLSRAAGKPRVAASYPVRRGWEDGISPSGYGYIKSSLPAFNAAATTRPFVVLIDGDNRHCPPETIAEWLGGAPQNPDLVVRVAVREVEAWLLADRQGLAEFLGVAEAAIPVDPSAISDPKECIVMLAQKSTRRAVREELTPRSGSRAQVGPYYTQALSQFAKSLWDSDAGAMLSDSLRRAKVALDRL